MRKSVLVLAFAIVLACNGCKQVDAVCDALARIGIPGLQCGPEPVQSE